MSLKQNPHRESFNRFVFYWFWIWNSFRFFIEQSSVRVSHSIRATANETSAVLSKLTEYIQFQVRCTLYNISVYVRGEYIFHFAFESIDFGCVEFSRTKCWVRRFSCSLFSPSLSAPRSAVECVCAKCRLPPPTDTSLSTLTPYKNEHA